MLILTRNQGEVVMIGDDIQIMVVRVGGDKVRLGIVAPSAVSIHRKEVYDAIKKDNRIAEGSVSRYEKAGASEGGE